MGYRPTLAIFVVTGEVGLPSRVLRVWRSRAAWTVRGDTLTSLPVTEDLAAVPALAWATAFVRIALLRLVIIRDERGFVHDLGVVLFELVAAVLPFNACSTARSSSLASLEVNDGGSQFGRFQVRG